jgi:hypothetical protein
MRELQENTSLGHRHSKHAKLYWKQATSLKQPEDKRLETATQFKVISLSFHGE